MNININVECTRHTHEMITGYCFEDPACYSEGRESIFARKGALLLALIETHSRGNKFTLLLNDWAYS